MYRFALPLLPLLAVLLAGCTTMDNLLFKGLAGEAPGEYRPAPAAVAEGALAAGPPGLGTTQFKPAPVAPLTSTGTEAGRRTAELREEFIALQSQIGQYGDELNLYRRSLRLNLDEYQNAVAGLRLSESRRLPDDTPQFAASTADARSKLGRVTADLLRLNGLATKVTIAAALGGQILQATRALANEPDVTPADARQIETFGREVNEAVILTHRMLAEIHSDISRQSEYAAGQRDAIDELAQAVTSGGTPPGTGRASATPPATAADPANTGAAAPVRAPAASARPSVDRPFVTIRFDQPDVDYGQTLYEAVQQALRRRPDLRFEVVGVSPAGAGGGATPSAMRRARAVMEALVQMGMPLDRLSMSAASSASAAADEVHLFVR